MKLLSIVTVSAILIMSGPALADVKTAKDREALFDAIVVQTMAREAWSPIKNEKYGVSYPGAFEPMRTDFINAQTEEDLYYAIVKLSNARNDRHLSVSTVEGGLKVRQQEPLVAPIRLMADFSETTPAFFVAAVGEDLSDVIGGDKIRVGDRVVRINGMAVEDYVKAVRPYHRASTERGFLMRFAMSLNQKSGLLPENYYAERFDLELRPKRGRRYRVSAPYLNPDDVVFGGSSANKYLGFERVLDFESFDFYRSTDGRDVVLFDWYGFRQDIVSAMDEAMAYADREGLLDHDVIWDGTHSRGGGRGAYAIQRLQSKPFKTTFGNLRLSDVVPLFVAERKAAFNKRQEMSDGTRETVGDGKWLIDWLTDDVLKGVAAGQAYSNTVPFKLAHAPKYSDGVLFPAEVHFKGKLVCWMSPRGGSHLDQFAAIVFDNGLCPILGMPAGGYSNTWEWDEVLTWPGTDEPVVRYMWSIGHTVRPNGEILEGNPADVDEYIPITAENVAEYDEILLRRTFEILDHERN